MRKLFPVALASVLGISPAASLLAQEAGTHHDHAPGAHSTARLGKVNFPNSGARAAQAPFLRGLALLHSFEYEDAEVAFREAQRADAKFAMAYWGEALTYAKLLWGLDNPKGARAALERLAPTSEARLKLAGTARERAYGEAVEALFQEADLRTRVNAYVEQLRVLNARYPKDLEARALLAISLQMNAGGMGYNAEQRAERTSEAISLAQSVFEAQPDHPGGAHYLIHATDNPKFAARGVKAARAYAKIAPDAEHALHMPSHIFVQLGLWDDVVSSNERAWESSRAWVKARGVPPTELGFHGFWWRQYGYLQQGRYREARALIDTVRKVLADVDWANSDAIDARYTLGRFQYTYGRETGDWSDFNYSKAAAVPPPTDTTPARARFHAFNADYAIAYGAAVQGDTVMAASFLSRFAGNAPMRVAARSTIAALIAKARGDVDRQIALLREAAAAEAQMVHSGPPDLVPANELLGNALLENGRPQEAIAAFRTSLELMPNRSASLLGLARAHFAAGDSKAAAENYGKLLQNYRKADPGIAVLTEAKSSTSVR